MSRFISESLENDIKVYRDMGKWSMGKQDAGVKNRIEFVQQDEKGTLWEVTRHTFASLYQCDIWPLWFMDANNGP